MAQPDLPFPTPNGFDTIIAERNPEWAEFLPVDTEVTIFPGAAVVDDQTVRLSPHQLLKATIVLRYLVRKAVELGGIPDSVERAWFIITTDREVVKRYGELHGCATCRAGTDQGLARLRERPADPLIVGVLAF